MASVSDTRAYGNTQDRSHLTSFKVTVCVGNVRTEHNFVEKRMGSLRGTVLLKLCRDLRQYGFQKRRSRSPMGAVEYKDSNRICPADNEMLSVTVYSSRRGGLTPLLQFSRRPWGLRTTRYSTQDFLPCGHHLGTILLGEKLDRQRFDIFQATARPSAPQ